MNIPNKFSLLDRLPKLAQQIKELRGPDRQMDIEIAVALGLYGYDLRGTSSVLAERSEDGQLEWSTALPTEMGVPEYTGCLTAAYSLALLLEHLGEVTIASPEENTGGSVVSVKASRGTAEGVGPTPAAALTAACLCVAAQ